MRQTGLTESVSVSSSEEPHEPLPHPNPRKGDRRDGLTHSRAAALSSAYKVTLTVFVSRRAAQLPPLFTSPVMAAYPLMHIYVPCLLLRLHVKTDVLAGGWGGGRRFCSYVLYSMKEKSSCFQCERSSALIALCVSAFTKCTLLCCHTFLFFEPCSPLSEGFTLAPSI